MAINNLNRAITHVEKARVKIHNRLLRNEKTLQRLSKIKKYNYPSVLDTIRARIKKNQEAETECYQIITELKERRIQLSRMIDAYGLSQLENPKKIKQLMGKCNTCLTELDVQSQPCRTEPYCTFLTFLGEKHG